MPLKMIITTANSVSRVSVGLFSPCNMIAVMLATSMTVTRERQDQRAVGLAELHCESLVVAHDRERRAEDDHEQPSEYSHQVCRLR